MLLLGMRCWFLSRLASMYISNFQSLTPPYLVPQAEGLNWLAHAHTRGTDQSPDLIQKLLNRYGCGPDRIAQRGTYLRDFTHQNWSEMQIFGDALQPTPLDGRMHFYHEALQRPVEDLYSEVQKPAFQNWIHVSCTGYLAPSLIQNIVSHRGWGHQVQCLHAYHMGCYAAIPALRMSRGNLDTEILHTELCTLHLDPSKHEPEQLVIQSLFADGVIRYSATQARPPIGFEILELKEWVLPDSLRDMTWDVSATGFKMTLAREVPSRVQSQILELIRPWQTTNCIYAVHPGGPRILDGIKAALSLSEDQLYFSRQVLLEHGNMSSATLPHIWNRMLTETPVSTPIISLAFGPGLTVAAALMVKVA